MKSTTMYLSVDVLAQLDQAQQAIDEHGGITVGGRCPQCAGVVPCRALVEANKTFARFGRSSRPPRRLPPTPPCEMLVRVA